MTGRGAGLILDIRSLGYAAAHLSAVDCTLVEDALAGVVSVPCRVDLDCRPSGGAWYVHATVEGEVSAVCHRCLEPVQRTVTGEFDLIVRRGEHGGEVADEVVVLGPHEHEVVLDPFIHETVVVNMPMVIVCRDDCQGLCPTCGANRNRESCHCKPSGDARWDALKKLK